MPFAVKVGAVARPAASVITVLLPLNVPDAPEAGALNVTLTPLSGLLPASTTLACSAVLKAVLIAALCGVPAFAVIVVAAPARFVSAKVVLSAPAVAVTLYEPAVPFAVKAGAVARPEASVTTVVEPAKLPEGPEAGALKVTLTPATGSLPASTTFATIKVPKAVLMVALCGVPSNEVIAAGTGGVFVRLNDAVRAFVVEAMTLYVPVAAFAVKTGAVAMPLAFVATVADDAKVPEAPEAGAVNVTAAPTTGALPASRTSACRLVGNGVLTLVLCGEPAKTLIEAGVATAGRKSVARMRGKNW